MKRFVLFAVAAVLLLGLCEMVLRLYGFGHGLRYETHPTLGWRMTPNQRAFNVRGRTEVRVNALGFRGPEVATPKPVGTLRLFFLGDGTTLNNQTPEAQSFPFLVATEFTKAIGRPVEAVVGATSGYQLEQELEQVRLYLSELQPDAVILGFCWNDWAPTTRPSPDTGPPAYGEYAGGEKVFQRTAIVDFFNRLQRIRARSRTAAAEARGEGLPSTSSDDAVWAHVSTTLDSTVALCRRQGATPFLVLMPAPVTSHDAQAYAQRTESLRTWAAAHRVVWVDLAPAFAAAEARGTSLYLDHLHLGPGAQPVVAAALIDALTKYPVGRGVEVLVTPEEHPVDPIPLPGSDR